MAMIMAMEDRKASSGRMREGSKCAILNAAERLFGEYGIAGASLRQIGAAAGQGNTYAVQYHFGSRENLVRAIHERRLPEIDERRGALFDMACRAGGEPGREVLLDCLWRPFLEFALDERRPFLPFLAQMLRSSQTREQRVSLDSLTPATTRIIGRLREGCREMPESTFGFRMLMGTHIMLAALTSDIDDLGGDRLSAYREGWLATVAYLGSPVSPPPLVRPDDGAAA